MDAPTEPETSYGWFTIPEERRAGTPDSYLLMLIEASKDASTEASDERSGRGSNLNCTSHKLHPGLRRPHSAARRHSIKELPSVMRSQLRNLFHFHRCVIIIILSTDES
jgi:hypothetical protein